METWLPAYGWENCYEVSNLGQVRSIDRVVMRSNGIPQTVKGRVLKTPPATVGYPHVHLWDHGRNKTIMVHQLVLESFLHARPDGMEVCHNDGDRSNNKLENLRWGTPSSNRFDSVLHGTHGWLKRNGK